MPKQCPVGVKEKKKGKESILVLACIYILKLLGLTEKLIMLVTCFGGMGTWQIEGRRGKETLLYIFLYFLMLELCECATTSKN